jgi:2-aminoadipate transaminase
MVGGTAVTATSAAAAAAAAAAGAAKTAARVYDFGTGMPDPGTFPARELAEAAQRVIVREGVGMTRYPDPRGYPPLRDVAVARFARNHGQQVPAGNVVITNGSMQAIILSTQALGRPGDTVIVEEFCYSGTLGVLRQYGMRVEGVPLDASGLRVDALAATIERVRAEGRRIAFVYTIATHQNPTGTIMPVERRRQVVELCRQHEIAIVEDDCYADVVFEGEMPPAMYTMAEPGRIVYVGSFSKILGPGVRLGYFMANEALVTKLLAYKRDGGTSALSAMIVAEYLKDTLWPHVADVCAAVKDKRDTLFGALERELGGLADWSRPHGGLFSWVRLPEGIDTQALQQLAKERNILYATGRAFDAADRDIPYLRLAFGYVNRDLIDEGVALLGECIEGAAPGSRQQVLATR